MKGHKNTGKKENNGLKSKKGNIILLVLLLLILLVVPCFALGASIGDDVKAVSYTHLVTPPSELITVAN